MSVPARLAAFAGVLALVFGGAALAGSRLGIDRGGTAPERDRPQGMRGMAADEGGRAAAQPVRGLAVSDAGLTLELARTAAPRGRRFELAFRIADRAGRTVRDFDVEHTKRMHLIVVRRDLTGFQHLHPVQRADGTWSVPVVLRDAGSYRVLADFSVGGTPRTLAADVDVDGPVRARPLPAATAATTVDGLRVQRTTGRVEAGVESRIGLTVRRHGRPVALRDFLGAKGHLVALREGDLAFLHVHPDERRLRFMATFPTAGRYRLFVQFKTAGGRLETAAFTQAVTR